MRDFVRECGLEGFYRLQQIKRGQGGNEMSDRRCVHAVAVLLAFVSASEVVGQGPTISNGGVGVPELGRNESSLGQMPGAGGNLSGNAPDANRPTIGGAPGTLTPKAPPSLSDPSAGGYQRLGGGGVGPI